MASEHTFEIPEKARMLAQEIRWLGTICRDLCPGASRVTRRKDSHAAGLQSCPNLGACERTAARSLMLSEELEAYASSIEILLRTSSESKALRRDEFEARLQLFVSQNSGMMDVFVENFERRAVRLKNCPVCKSRREILDLVLVCDSTYLSMGPTRDTLRYATAVADIFAAVFRCHPNYQESSQKVRWATTEEERDLISAENESRPIGRYFQLDSEQRHLDCRDWLPETLFDNRTLAPLKPLADQWFRVWPNDAFPDTLMTVVDDAASTPPVAGLPSAGSISEQDYQRLKDDLARLRVEHDDLQQRTEKIVCQLMQTQANAQEWSTPLQGVLTPQGRTYSSATVTRGATAIFGDIVHNYVIQDNYHRPFSQDVAPAAPP